MVLLDALAGSLPIFFIAAVLVLGLLVGSFLNVVIYRVPIILERQWRVQCAQLANPDAAAVPEPPLPRFNLVVPRSTCPKCQAPITAVQNIPVLSYLFLRGRCASCGTHISVRYPLIEALTGALSALVAWKFGYGAAALAALVLTWFLIALTFIDVDTQLLPDSMTLPLVWLGVACSAFLQTNPQGSLPVSLHDSIVGAMAGYLEPVEHLPLVQAAHGQGRHGLRGLQVAGRHRRVPGLAHAVAHGTGRSRRGCGGRHGDPDHEGKGPRGPDRLRAVPGGLGLDHDDVGS